MFPKIEAKFKLPQIFLLVLGRYPNMSSVDAAFEPRPKAFNGVGMNRSAHVFLLAVVDLSTAEQS